ANLCDAGIGAACGAAGDQRGEIDVEPIDPLKKPAAQLPWYERGCDAGDAWSCFRLWEMATNKQIDADPEPVQARAVTRARAECDAGVAWSCIRLFQLGEAPPERSAKPAVEGCFAGLLTDCELTVRADASTY